MADSNVCALPAAGLHLWSALPQGVSVYVHSDALRSLLAETSRGLKLLPKRGAEVGGILLGSAAVSGGSLSVTIQSVEPVACAYSAGPTWTLSTHERAQLAARVRELRRAEAVVVGCYRSHVRSKPGMSSEDFDLYQSCFAGAHDLFLLVQPAAGESALAEIFYRDGASIRTLPGQFDLVPRAAPAAVAPVPAPPKTGWRRWKLPLIAALVTLLTTGAAALGIYSYRAWREAAPLGLQVERRSDNIMLSWNGSSVLVRSARRGYLIVREGASQRDIDLSAGQLRAGRLFYLTASNDVDLRLDIEQPDGRRIGESIMILGAIPQHPATVPEKASVVVPAVTAARPEAHRALPARAQFVPPPEAVQPRAPQPLDAPPPLTAAGRIPLPPQPGLLGPLPTPVAAAPAPVASRTPAPVAPAPRAVNDYAPAEAVRQVRPSLPPDLRGRFLGRVEVRVRVAIDDSGKVTHAAIASFQGALAALLTEPVLTAARQWQFTPARANGHALPSEKILVFEFAGK